MEDRNRKIYFERESGLTYAEIAKKHKITPQRAMQIYNKYRYIIQYEKDDFYMEIRKFAENDASALRVFRVLKRRGINSIEELKALSDEEISKIRSCGAVAQKLIRKIIDR